MPTTAGAYQRALKRFKRRGMMLSESRLSLQCKAQTSGAFFPESYFPEIAGILVGVFLYLVERDRRRLPRCARHILRRQRENEGSGIGRPGAVDQAELAADVAFYIEQFKSLRHLALYKAGTARPPLNLSRGRYAKALPAKAPPWAYHLRRCAIATPLERASPQGEPAEGKT
jgi:hypothetical protein